ncbi:MAG: NrpR regulatory domain-containing protein [Candidatus Bathyarchaeia archaeon]
MNFGQEEVYRKQIEILRILSEQNEPIGSSLLRRELAKRGFPLSERAIRYHLKLLEERGLVEGHEKAGRTITELGLEELSRALAYERVGFILTWYLSLAYRVTYSPESGKGEVVANVFMVDRNFKEEAIKAVRNLYYAGLLPAPYVKILDEEEYREISAPEGKIALMTVCNLTIDGILIHSGVPLILKYGGLVQFIKWKPIRFTELIAYDSTTVPPLEVFVYRKMTSIASILKTGSGMIPANIREIPAVSMDQTFKIIEELKKSGWGGILAFGKPNEPILGVPVSMDRCGISMVGGLIPAALLTEMGIPVETYAPHCLVPIEDMEKVKE